MPKSLWASILLGFVTLAAAGCSSAPPAPKGDGKIGQEDLRAHIPAEESYSHAPGMIPSECEALLNQSQQWGYTPGQKWKAASREQMLEVSGFFAEFHLVPAATSEVIQRREGNGGDAQVCDPFLSQTFLEALVGYAWGKADRLTAGRNLHRFLLNQQALALPLVHRSLATQTYLSAVKKGLVPGSHAKASALNVWMQKEMAKLPPVHEDEVTSLHNRLREELILSNKIRDRMGPLLPLP